MIFRCPSCSGLRIRVSYLIPVCIFFLRQKPLESLCLRGLMSYLYPFQKGFAEELLNLLTWAPPINLPLLGLMLCKPRMFLLGKCTNLDTCVSKTLIRLIRCVRWLEKAWSGELEHAGAGWAGLLGRLVGSRDCLVC